MNWTRSRKASSPSLSMALAVVTFMGLLMGGQTVRAQSGFDPPSVISSNNVSDSFPQLLADEAGTWLTVWPSADDLGGTTSNDLDLVVARSIDGGQTWSGPVLLNANGTNDVAADLRPRVATDRLGRWVVVWHSSENLGGAIDTDSDILVSVSTNDGVTWSYPQPLNTNAGLDTGDDYSPWIASVTTGVWVAVWDSTEDLGGTAETDQDILFARSTDDGTTWSAPMLVDGSATNDASPDFRPTVDGDGAGRAVVAWSLYDSGTDLSDILVARSADGGQTWHSPTGLHSTAFANDGQDFTPHIRTDRLGAWLVVWESGSTLNGALDDDQDILFARSGDHGASWTLPAPIHGNAASESDQDGFPWLGTDGEGNWVAAWNSEFDLNGALGGDGDILMTRSLDGGISWNGLTALSRNAAGDAGFDSRPQVTSDRAGRWLAAWNSTEDLGGTAGTDSDVFISAALRPLFWTPPAALNSTADADTGADLAAVCATDGKGHGVVVWRSSENLGGTAGTDTDIFVSHSGDNGSTWSPAAVLHAFATNMDNAVDSEPVLATDGDGTWIAAWESSFNLGGMLGTDQDILFTRSLDNGQNWSTPAALNTGAATNNYSDFEVSLAADGHGNWVAVWQISGSVPYGADTDIAVARSSDDGQNWSAPAVPKSTAATDDGHGDFHPEVATDGLGHWVMVWNSNDPYTNSFNKGDDDDLMISHSYDNGAAWTPEVPLNSNAAVDDPEDDEFDAHAAADGQGGWIVVCRMEGVATNVFGADDDIFYVHSVDDGTNWTALINLDVNAAVDTKGDTNPRVATDGAGRWVVAWTSQEPVLGSNDVVFSSSVDGGQRWSDAAVLDRQAMLDSGFDGRPSIAFGASNRWICAWNTSSPLSGLDGSDADIAFALADDDQDLSLAITSVAVSGGLVQLQWAGGMPPHQAQWSTNLFQGGWMDLGPMTNKGPLSLPLPGAPAFFRVR